MAGLFEPAPDGGAAIALDSVEISILRNLTAQLLELIGPGPGAAEGPDGPGADADPLAALFADGPTKPPADPALARLFPDAYRPDALGEGPESADEAAAASAEFRRYTENDLRARKREDGLAMIRTLDAASAGAAGGGGAVVRLGAEDCGHWLGALNDLRLTLGSRLEIDDDESTEIYELADDDPRKPLAMAYLWLGGLQETLLEVLMG
ncbi:DUF2017 domain-containing protein [Phaeacidiphilus oryzae]|uniref:DUF2017 domain-containing protein n=1 Tax=Phaeacidiphilus oryzae TaxID=348818 RepID=UPI0005675CCB|nr:DUF2017 domain-containing protein [Phaeacidiphilus oryzae]